ncbi:hypothetical protein CHS0354_014289 [Potamilus streckersoni]|uniref:J domain-containing protein n=1 Tax=Potamilus streckersoni TaxID=2493646 RepID=A0AAE0SL57_9BIVA|nr:hypothetical protein CHS0354_014289 [Potamilus streckersoni]
MAAPMKVVPLTLAPRLITYRLQPFTHFSRKKHHLSVAGTNYNTKYDVNGMVSGSDARFTPNQCQFSARVQLIRCHSGLLKERKCWKCGSETNNVSELFFCNCGVIQSIPSDISYFQVFGFKPDFCLDTEVLSKSYKELQRNIHPDKYNQRSEELELAAEQSSFINKAYFTLLKPYSRGLYLLEFLGEKIDEETAHIDQEFLLHIMEINEKLSEATDMKQIEKIEEENNVKLIKCVAELNESFNKGDIQQAKATLIRLKYFENIDDKVKAFYRRSMG